MCEANKPLINIYKSPVLFIGTTQLEFQAKVLTVVEVLLCYCVEATPDISGLVIKLLSGGSWIKVGEGVECDTFIGSPKTEQYNT